MEIKGLVEPLDKRLLLIFTPVTPSVPVGDGPVAIVTADFNRDGKPDVATANANSKNISILLGNGSGGFTAGLPVTVENQPSAITAADFNRDGISDLAVAYFSDPFAKVVVLQGNGSGGFTAGTPISGGFDLRALAAADITRDGRQDLLVTNASNNDVKILVANTNGGFQTLPSVPVGSNPNSIAVEDINRDGLLDFITANTNSNNISIRLGTGFGNFSAQTTVAVGTGPKTVVIADVNSDGKPDVVTANSTSNNVSILIGNGSGGFTAQPPVALGASPQNMITADINGDGRPDIITANSNSTLSVLAGNGNGTFPTVKTIETTQANAVAAADLNADGKPEVVMAHFNADTLGVLQNRSTNHSAANFAKPVEFSPFNNFVTPLVNYTGDVNGDGFIDIIQNYYGSPPGSQDRSQFVAMVGNGSGGFIAKTPVTTNNISSIPIHTIADINSDGRSDVIFPSQSVDGVSAVFGDANGEFSNSRLLFDPSGSEFGVEFAFINGDQILDAYVTHAGNFDTDKLTIYAGNTDGSYTLLQSIDIGMKINNLDLVDINNDGLLDQFITTQLFELGVRIANGTGTYLPYTSLGISTLYKDLIFVDMNGDGNQDIITTHPQDNNIRFRLGNGLGGFTATTNLQVTREPESIRIGDVNGDLIPDIVAIYGIGRLEVLIGNGSAGFTLRAPIFDLFGVKDIALADYNADGKLDLYTLTTFGTTSVYMGNGQGDFLPTSSLGTLVNDKPDVIAIADVNGDAVNDLLSVNDGDGNLGVFTGNGSGGFSAMAGSPISTQSSPSSVATADINADGRMDIVIGSSFSLEDIRVLLANSNGSFTTGPFFSHTESVNSFALADFNRDGKVDLVTANKTSSTFSDSITLFTGDGSGGFASPQTYSTFSDGAVSIAVADLNRDGIPDIVVAESQGNSVTVFLGDGNGLILSRFPYSVGTKPVSVAVADFNGDGKVDIATANQTSNNVSILLGNGAGSFTDPTSFAVGSSPKNLSIADVNGDGKQDIVTANAVGKSISILLGTGTGGFATATSIPIGVTPNFVTLADINRDNAVDIIYSNNENENVSYLFNQRSRPTKLQLSAQASTRPGNTIPLVIEALTQNNQLSSLYTGSVRLTSTDPAAVLTSGLAYSVEGNVSFRVGDLGSRTVQIKLNTLGTQTITATDIYTGSIIGSITVEVAENRVPTDIQLSSNTILDDKPVGTTIGQFSTTDPDSNNTFMYTLASGIGDDDNASFSISGNNLLSATAFNFQTKSSYSIRVRSTDQSGLFNEKTLTITILKGNSAPTDLTLSGNSILENQPIGSTIGTLTAVDIDTNNTFTYSLVSGTGSTDNAQFSINGNTLRSAASFNFESKSSYSIRVRTTDQGGLFLDKIVTISVLNVNEAPKDIVRVGSIAENQPIGTIAATLSSVDDDINDTFTYSFVSSVPNTVNHLFSISGDKIMTRAILDYETIFIPTIYVRTTDQSGLTYERSLNILLFDVNEAPTNITFSGSTIPENQPIGTTVGTFNAFDPDFYGSVFFSLDSGPTGTDNAKFSLSGNILKTAEIFDFEAKSSSYSILVRATDSGGLFSSRTFFVSITNINETPTNISLSVDSYSENNTIASTIGTLSTIDSDIGNTYTYTLVSGTGSTDNASFTISGNLLRAASSFNFEDKSSYSLRVRSTDNTGLFFEKALTLGITNVNEAPDDFNLSDNMVDEAQPVGTFVGTFSTTDPDVGNTFTYALVTGTGATDNARFTISGDKLITAAIFDFETKSSYSIRLRTTDQNGLSLTKVITIGVNNVNEAPVNLSLSGTSLAENMPVGTLVGDFSSIDPDTNNTFTYSLVAGSGDADNASFSISGNQLVSGAVLDIESKAAYSIRVRSTDQGGLFVEKVFVITPTNVNEAPANLSLAANSVAENQPIGTPIGALTVQDPDLSDTFTYTLVPGSGDADNSRFAIVGSALHTAEVLDFETKATYSVRIRATDQGSLFIEKDLIVNVTNANDAPNNILLSGNTLAENQPSGTLIGTFSTLDQDPGNTFTYTIVGGTGSIHNSLFLIVGDTLRAAAPFDFDLQPNYSLRVRATDQNGLFAEKVFNIQSTNVNEPPMDIVLTTGSVTENNPLGTSVGSFVTTDPDAGSSFTYSLVAGNGDADNASFTISGNVILTAAAFDFETKSSYSVRIRAVDQGGLAKDKAIVISVVNANEMPLEIGLSSPNGVSITSATLAENLPGGTVVGSFNTADLDISNSFTYSLVAGDGGDDNAGFIILGNSLVTAASLDFESKSSYSIRIRSTDEGGLSTEQAFSISLTNANDAPVDLQLMRDGAGQSQAANSDLGTFSTSDQDAGDTFVYSLVAGSGDGDNSLFAISGSTLSTAPTFSPSKQVYSIRVRSTDRDGLFTEQSLSLPFTTQLSISSVPSNGFATQPLLPFVVRVTDLAGNVLTGDTSQIALSIASGPAGGVLGGTLTAGLVNGVATFTDLTVSVAGTYTFTATANGLNAVLSSSFDVAQPDQSLMIERGNAQSTAPDLMLSTVKFRPIKTPLFGGTVLSGTISVRNAGIEVLSGSTTVQFFFSSDAVPSTFDTSSGTISTGALRLTPGKSRSIPFSVTLPSALQGSHQMLALVNASGELAEKTTLNNALRLRDVNIVAPALNLKAGTAISKSVVEVGKAHAITLPVQNIGNQPANSGFQISATFVDSASGQSTNMGTFMSRSKLQPGKSTSVRLNVIFPADLASRSGQVFLSIVPSGSLADTNATDNVSSINVTVLPA